MNVIRSAQKMTLWSKSNGRRIGFVPTMGFLHGGHLAIVRRAKKENDAVVVSIFVNPTQFGPKEDFSKYPRNLKKDLALLRKEKVDVVLVPSVADIYPGGVTSTVRAGPVSKPLEGAFRPGHFNGVATVVKRLFDIVRPHAAYFGQKDFQQVLVVKDLVKRFKIPVKIVVCPTVRERDGLALSSRNAYLSRTERAIAPVLCQTLRLAKTELKKGTGLREVEQIASAVLMLAGFGVQYVAVVDAKTLKPAGKKTEKVAILAAAYLGKTRLIDNLTV